MAILQADGLTYIYGKNTPYQKEAVTNVNLKIEKPCLAALIGHTGSGKSTLVQMLNGLIKPTSGKVFLNGKDIWEDEDNIRQIRFKVGIVFQYPEYQLFEDTVEKDIAFGPKNLGLNDEEIKRRVLWASETVGLNKELLAKSPFDLSGGEKRRAAIAGVLAMQPEVLILDEPTAGLDPKGRDNLLKQIVKYQKENNKTVIIVSHSMEDVAKIADEVFVMYNGQLEMSGTTKEVFSNSEKLENMSLSVPQITKLMKKIKNSGFDIDDNILTVDEAVKALLKLKGGAK